MTNISMLLREYINALVLNIDSTKLPKEIDLVFSGGAFNCIFGLGILYYIKALEERKLTKVVRVSGCSAGAILALWYITNPDEDMDMLFTNIVTCFKKNLNFKGYQEKVKEIVNKVFYNEDNLNILNGRLFISFYDMKKGKQKTINKYKSKEHLIDCLLSSSHIPRLTDGNLRYKERYMDGITPYIFNDAKRETLIIELMTSKKLLRSITFKKEVNSYFRLLAGVADASQFFSDGHSDMCMYYKNWSYIDFLIHRGKELFVFFIFSLIELIYACKIYIPNSLTKTTIYHGCSKVLHEVCGDTFSHIIA